MQRIILFSGIIALQFALVVAQIHQHQRYVSLTRDVAAYLHEIVIAEQEISAAHAAWLKITSPESVSTVAREKLQLQPINLSQIRGNHPLP